jgi:hypothetical protein
MRLTKHFNTKKLMLTFLAGSILILATGCSSASKGPSQPTSSTKQSPGLSPSPKPSAADTQQDKDLTKKLTSEKIVQSGQVYIAGNDAVAVIIIKSGTDQKIIKPLATKYANTMKQKYSNKTINSHAFLNGKEMAHITL